MRCAECEKVIPDDAAYCAYCGAKAAASGLHAPIFRFADSADQAATLKDLAYLIDRNWEASLRHLYEGDFANWLGALGRGVLADQARDIVKAYPDDRPLGLELFVNVIADAAKADIPPAGPELSPKRIDFGVAPRDNITQVKLVITNKRDRGYLSGRLRLPPGVFWLTCSPREFTGPRTEITLTANTRDMPAGAHHRTTLIVTTLFETVETDVTLRVSTEWAALLRAMVVWALTGALGMFLASGAALLLNDLLPNVPWLPVYIVLAVIAAVVSFGSIKTRDAAAAIALSALIGVATLIPIALGALAVGFALRLLHYQATTIARAVESTGVALAAMMGVGAALGVIAGLFVGLRRVRRAPTGLLLAAALLAALTVGVYTFRPAVVLGEFRSSQPFLTDLAIPVPYLAFAPTLPAPGSGPPPTPTRPAPPTPLPSPTPAIRPVANVTLLWDVVPVEEGMNASAVSGALDSQGRAHVAYVVSGDGGAELRYAVQEEAGWAIATVDAGDLGYAALALDAEGRPYIAYATGVASDAQVRLSLASLEAETNAWAVESIDGPGAGRWPALVIDPAGQPVIAYFDARASDLRVARRTEFGWAPETVDPVGDVGYCPALALDAGGLPHVVYIDAETEALRYNRYTGADWFAIAVPYERRVGCDTALALSPNGARYLLFHDLEGGRVVEGAFVDDEWHFTQIGAARPLADGRVPLSLTLGADGRAQLTYNSPTSLRHVRDDGTQWLNAVVDGPSPAHQVVIDRAGGAHIVYAFQGGVWYASLRAGLLSVLPTTPTPGPSPTPTAPAFVCGDGICQDPAADCALDCQGEGWACGDAVCEEEFEDPLSCPADCAGTEGF